MKTTFTHKHMLANKGCYSEVELMKCSFMKNKTVTLKDILESEISIADKFWFVYNGKVLTAKEVVKLDDKCKELIINYYKENFPSMVEWVEGYLKTRSGGGWSVLVVDYFSNLHGPGGLQLLKNFCLK